MQKQKDELKIKNQEDDFIITQKAFAEFNRTKAFWFVKNR